MERSRKESPIWGIARRKDGRYVIIDTVTSDVLHGGKFGYTSYVKEYNYGYNQYHTEPVNYVVGISEKSVVVENPLF